MEKPKEVQKDRFEVFILGLMLAIFLLWVFGCHGGGNAGHPVVRPCDTDLDADNGCGNDKEDGGSEDCDERPPCGPGKDGGSDR